MIHSILEYRLSIFQIGVILITLHQVSCYEFCGNSKLETPSSREGFLNRRILEVKRIHEYSPARQKRQAARSTPRVNQQREEQLLIDDQSSVKQILEEQFKQQAAPIENRIDCTNRVGNSKQLAAECAKSKTIETAVFVDPALDGKFNGLSNGLVELNKLIVTIMNQVQSLFKYSSMKVPINIKLVLVEHMSVSKGSANNLPLPNPENGDIDLYLSNFCNWQQAKLEREKRLWWDHAILLSG